MESHKSIQSIHSASTSFSENILQNENVHDDIVQYESENGLYEDLISNEFENILHNNDEDLISNMNLKMFYMIMMKI